MPKLSLQTIIAYLIQHSEQTIESRKQHKLATIGITSAVQYVMDMREESAVQADIMTLGIAGKITKQGTSLCNDLIDDMMAGSTASVKHLVVLVDSATPIDFSFYKLLTDILVTKQIQSVHFVSQASDMCIDRGIDFIRKFSSGMTVQHMVDTALPIDRVLANYTTQTHATT